MKCKCPECGSEKFKIDSYHDGESKQQKLPIILAYCECSLCGRVYSYEFPNEAMMRQAERNSQL